MREYLILLIVVMFILFGALYFTSPMQLLPECKEHQVPLYCVQD